MILSMCSYQFVNACNADEDTIALLEPEKTLIYGYVHLNYFMYQVRVAPTVHNLLWIVFANQGKIR